MASALNTIPGFSALKPIFAPRTKNPCYVLYTKKTYLSGRIVRASSEATTVNESVNGVARVNGVVKRSQFTSNFEAKIRFNFLEELMQCARRGDVKGATAAMDDMISAGLNPGPHSFHGLIVAHVFAGDEHGVMQVLRKEASLGLRPLEETFVAVVRLFGSKGDELRGEEILATMENFKFDIRRAWLVLVEELFKAGYLQKANDVLLKGVEGGLRGTDRLYDLLIVENCKAGDHANAFMIVKNMEAYGRMPTTFHFNCLLSVQATSGFPEIAANTFEKMECGEDFMKPDTETYNWVFEAHLRANSGNRCEDIINMVGVMVEDRKRVQPNVKTYALIGNAVERAKAFVEEQKEEWTKFGCTILSDGWTDGKSRTIINFLACCNDNVVFLKSIDASSKVKNAETLALMLENTFLEIGIENVVQIITDNAAAYVSAGKLLQQRHPTLSWTPCAAHVLDLLLEDMGKLEWVTPIVEDARRVTKYIYNHPWVLSLMREHTDGKEIVRPAVTRFATIFLTLQSILDNLASLKQMFVSKKWLASTFSKKSEGENVVRIVFEKYFEDKADEIVKVSEPLVKVLRLVDGDQTPMGELYEAMDKAKESVKNYYKGESIKYEPIWQIIDRRWNNQLHQPIHAAGYFLNPRFRLLVESFTKYGIINEALRHFRALKCYQGAMKILHNDGKHGDPLSLYLRAVCLEGRAVELLEALEAMASDNQSIAPRAMIVNGKGRTLVSSWIEPLEEEAEIGFEVDHIARYIAEGGLTGERKRWVPRGCPLDPDREGFIYLHSQISYKERCSENLKTYNIRLLTKLLNEGEGALGVHLTKPNFYRLLAKMQEDIAGYDIPEPRPKAASKMLVYELKEELEAQGEPAHGNRQELYQRVQKKRRINRSKGIPLWVPPVQIDESEVDDELQDLISKLQASYAKEDTEFWRNRFRHFTGEIVDDGEQVEKQAANPVFSDDLVENVSDQDGDEDENVSDQDGDEDKGGKDEDEEEAVGDSVVDLSTSSPKLFSQKLSTDEQNEEEESKTEHPEEIELIWKEPEPWYAKATTEEICKYLKYRMRFDASEMYTIEDAWGWTWAKELRAKVPEMWTQEKEVKIAMEIMDKVIEIGGTPTIGDCAMILRAAMRVPLPSAMVSILRRAHSLGYIFGSPVYDEVITLCMDLWERDAAVAIVTDLEEAGIHVSNETLEKVLQE